MGNVEEVKSFCQKLIKTAEKVGLQVDAGKTVYIMVNRREVNNHRKGEIIKEENHSFI